MENNREVMDTQELNKLSTEMIQYLYDVLSKELLTKEQEMVRLLKERNEMEPLVRIISTILSARKYWEKEKKDGMLE